MLLKCDTSITSLLYMPCLFLETIRVLSLYFVPLTYFAVPSIPRNVRAYVKHVYANETTPTSCVTIQWQAPSQLNGVITHYRLYTSEHSHGDWTVHTITETLDAPAIVLEQLRYKQRYYFQVCSKKNIHIIQLFYHYR